MAGKPGGVIVSCAVPADSTTMPPACEYDINAIRFYMMEEGMDFIGEVRVKGNVPCVGCDYGDSCEMSGIKMLYGPEAVKASVGIKIFEEQRDAVQAAVNLGKSIVAK